MENSLNSFKRSGYNFLSLLNDIKRRPEDAAQELEVSIEEIELIIAGKKNISSKLIEKAVEIWPVNERDFYIIHDDCPTGILIMKSEDSKRSSRVFNRLNRLKIKTPYYEYRDTAMSKIGSYKPEWIKELRIVEDNDPYNPDVIYNNGHFMHQITFFVGPVNFYWEVKGKKYCREKGLHG